MGGEEARSVLFYARQTTNKILEKISSPSSEAVFSSSAKIPGGLSERLNTISIYDKHDGTPKLSSITSLVYTDILVQNYGSDIRSYLTKVNRSAGCVSLDYTMEYDLRNLGPREFADVEDWEFLNSGNPISESITAGTLKKIIYPYKGYDAFFYEAHDYWNGTVYEKGAGVRLARMISHDGVSSNNDLVRDYEYKGIDGNSSGRLQYFPFNAFPVAKLENRRINSENWYVEGPRYQERVSTYSASELSRMFTVRSNEALSPVTQFNGSAVAYQRVIVKEKNAGSSAYEYDLAGSVDDVSANNNEWKASRVFIARPSTGSSTCYAVAEITEGVNRYPFPPSADYDFAKGLLKKSTYYDDSGFKVRETAYQYKRLYANGSGIRKIYGLKLEELPTYYHNGTAYVDNKMFLYSKYEILTDIKIELATIAQTTFNSSDLSKKNTLTTNFFYDSPNHHELTRVEKQNSDGSTTINRLKYTKDYAITAPNDDQSIAISNLNTAHRSMLIESTTSKLQSGLEKNISGNITLFKTISGKVLPDKLYSFISTEGLPSFSPSSVSGGSTFTFDQTNYVLQKSFLSYDSYGNVTEMIDASRKVASIAYGFGGTVPILSVLNARLGEIRFSDYETSLSTDFTIIWSSPTYSVGRNSGKSLNLLVGNSSTNNLNYALTNTNAKTYYLSCWIKSAVPGNLSLYIGTSTSTTFTLPFASSGEFKYYVFKIPVSSVSGSATGFLAKLWSSVAIQIDDLALYPEHAEFSSDVYAFPYGKIGETDSHGRSIFYEYDLWGRTRVISDQDKNILMRNEYFVKP
jgi:hypothetical protein